MYRSHLLSTFGRQRSPTYGEALYDNGSATLRRAVVTSLNLHDCRCHRRRRRRRPATAATPCHHRYGTPPGARRPKRPSLDSRTGRSWMPVMILCKAVTRLTVFYTVAGNRGFRGAEAWHGCFVPERRWDVGLCAFGLDLGEGGDETPGGFVDAGRLAIGTWRSICVRLQRS
jgi:hypothetical protein